MERSTALSPSTTKHRLIADVLSGEIQDGKYKIGDLLPSEPDLSTRFGVSRHTVRAALRSLQSLGLVASRRGVGTEVRGTRLVTRYSHSFGSAEDLFQYATSTRVRVLDTAEVVIDASLAAQFGCKAGEHWWRIRTIRLEAADDAVVAYSEIHIPLAYGAVVKHLERSNQPIFALIESLFHDAISEIRQDITCLAQVADDEASHLQIPPRSPAMQTTRHYLGRDGRTLEVARSVHPPELFKYSMRLQLRHGA